MCSEIPCPKSDLLQTRGTPFSIWLNKNQQVLNRELASQLHLTVKCTNEQCLVNNQNQKAFTEQLVLSLPLSKRDPKSLAVLDLCRHELNKPFQVTRQLVETQTRVEAFLEPGQQMVGLLDSGRRLGTVFKTQDKLKLQR